MASLLADKTFFAYFLGLDIPRSWEELSKEDKRHPSSYNSCPIFQSSKHKDAGRHLHVCKALAKIPGTEVLLWSTASLHPLGIPSAAEYE